MGYTDVKKFMLYADGEDRDINENSQFMEDLEMLTTTNDETLPNFMEETSPSHSQNELGSFKLQGVSNPLEQLGLYMKLRRR